MIGIAPEAWKQLLEPKQVVHFVGSHPEFWQERVAGKYFRIMMTQQIPYDRAYILAAGGTYSTDISDDNAAIGDLGLYPDNTMTLYEILLGMKSTSGSMLCYPRYPPNEWFITLEEGGFIPNVANNNLRYLGPWSEEITPYDRPQVRIHTIKEEESVGIMLYNDAPIHNKVVLGWLVNRCLMKYVDKSELTDKELERCRELIHAGLVTRGHWGETVP
jgi:hypothetical protein